LLHDHRLLHFRQTPAVAIVEQETPLGTERVLTEITLGAAGRFAAFDDLVTLTVRAANGDERHGPFLPMRSYEDEAQCGIYLSPSPLLKHYPIFDLIPVAIGPTQEDTAIHRTVGARTGGFDDIHNDHIPSLLVVERVTVHRKPPEVRICRLRNQSSVGTRPPSTSTTHWPACWARR